MKIYRFLLSLIGFKSATADAQYLHTPYTQITPLAAFYLFLCHIRQRWSLRLHGAINLRVKTRVYKSLCANFLISQFFIMRLEFWFSHYLRECTASATLNDRAIKRIYDDTCVRCALGCVIPEDSIAHLGIKNR